jgi:hypothetical protein
MEIFSVGLPVIYLAIDFRQFCVNLNFLLVWNPNFDDLQFLDCVLADVAGFLICEYLIKNFGEIFKTKLVGKLFKLAKQE